MFLVFTLATTRRACNEMVSMYFFLFVLSRGFLEFKVIIVALEWYVVDGVLIAIVHIGAFDCATKLT